MHSHFWKWKAPAFFIIVVAIALMPCIAEDANGQDSPSRNDTVGRSTSSPSLGVTLSNPEALPGYTLVFPLRSKRTYLVDLEGRVVKQWDSQYTAGQEAYLLENGNLLRAANLAEDEGYFAGASQGGRIQEFTWDGELVWDFKYHDEKQIRHHAITRLPNGNIMLIVWERKTADECIAAGVNPEYAGDGEILVDCLVEVKPIGKTSGEVVWEWHIWDHLVQDHDKTKANYGDVGAHPELIDVNYARANGGFFGNFARGFGRPPATDRNAGSDTRPDRSAQDDAVRRLQGIGYVGTAPRRGGARAPIPDWTHVNAVSYNEKLDQIMLSPREFNEVWIIDHSTTTAEAASHRGGRYGKGGDLLYRWGDPHAYRAGTADDQRLFSQHDAHWIPDGLPGAGNLLVFNNGGGRPEGNYSSVDEVVLPVSAEGDYQREPGAAFGPSEPIWSYTAKNPSDFFAALMAGAQRLPRGNTLICTGFSGEIIEVTPQKEIVWRFIVPDDASGGPGGFGPPRGFAGAAGPGAPPGFGPPGGFAPPAGSVSILPGPLRMMLQVTPDRAKQLDEFEKQASATFDELLTDEQQKQFKAIKADPAQWGPPEEIRIGKIITSDITEQLKLSAEQQQSFKELQSSVDEAMANIFTDDQRQQFAQIEGMIQAFVGGAPNFGPPDRGPNFGPPGGGPNFGPPGRDRSRRDRLGPGGFGGPPGFMSGVPGSAAVFRAYRYGVDFPAFADKTMTPGKKLVEIAEAEKNGNNSDDEGTNDGE